MTQVVYLCAGLANRMFQYAFYLSLKKRGYKVKIADNSRVKELKHEDVSISEIFPNVHYEKASNIQIFLLGGSNDIFSRIIRNRVKIFSPFYIRTAAQEGFKSCLFKLKHSAFHSGVFQSEKYFENVKEQVRYAFQFQPFLPHSKNYELMNKMKNENSVAIHIRKGNDYLTGLPYINTCGVEYYKKAIDYIKLNIDNPIFYVFTDNPQWVTKYLGCYIPYKLVNWNPAIGFGNHFDMQLMSYAKHNIIANSTYSWWGAWLNKNPHKIVIAPKQWFNPNVEKFNRIKDLQIIPESWIAL